MADISALLDQSLFEPIDPAITQEVLNKSPFVPIPGVANFRDLGGLPIVDPNTFNSITPEGKTKLFELDVGAIFDFRTTMEIRREARLPQDADVKSGVPEFKRPKSSHDSSHAGDVSLDEIEEICVYHNPLKDITQHAPQALMKLLTQMSAGDVGMIGSYEDILAEGGKSFGNIMRFLLEQAEKEVSEGVVEVKDSKLLGVPDTLIAHDYALTRIGLEPLREALETQFKDLKAANQAAALTLGSSKASTMMTLLELLRTKYGGARGYFKEYSELTDEELDTIRRSLIVNSQEQSFDGVYSRLWTHQTAVCWCLPQIIVTTSRAIGAATQFDNSVPFASPPQSPANIHLHNRFVTGIKSIPETDCASRGANKGDRLHLQVTATVLSAPPFISVPGVVNFRDLGGLPITRGTSEGTGAAAGISTTTTNGSPSTGANELDDRWVVGSGRLFRCAQLNLITPEGRERLFDPLDVGAIFDLRTMAEVRRYAGVPADSQDPTAGLMQFNRARQPGSSGGGEDGGNGEEEIKVYHVPLRDVALSSPQATLERLMIYGKGEEGFMEMYEEMLVLGGKSFGQIMRFLLQTAKEEYVQVEEGQWKGKACLWHCFVGKDRTGVFAALLLNLLGVSDEVIAHDYSLTRIGLEPSREAIKEQFKQIIIADRQAAIALASSNASLMLRFLGLLKTKYGGARAYFKEYSGLTDDELDLIKRSLINVTLGIRNRGEQQYTSGKNTLQLDPVDLSSFTTKSQQEALLYSPSSYLINPDYSAYEPSREPQRVSKVRIRLRCFAYPPSCELTTTTYRVVSAPGKTQVS
ncbi:11724_t:CDS:10 [Acaulospora colombiana]|uniref:11724_t:CDS:1 n=1 Tax=Acaulospora colombiana TaxID=27376 RepID=A0ACA9ML47_9GLOM|nr:11724_t:CDS:10 [Acaulospora colombiana]